VCDKPTAAAYIYYYCFGFVSSNSMHIEKISIRIPPPGPTPPSLASYGDGEGGKAGAHFKKLKPVSPSLSLLLLALLSSPSLSLLSLLALSSPLFNVMFTHRKAELNIFSLIVIKAPQIYQTFYFFSSYY